MSSGGRLRVAAAWLCLLAALGADAAPASHPSLIAWQPDLAVKRSERIFPSPHDAFWVWVATAAGIMETRDDGGAWRLLPGTGRDQLGRIADVVFAPASTGVILLASQDRGVFRSDDDGATWRNVGTVESGLAAPRVVRLGWVPGDRRGRVVYAAHGDAAAGLSKSIDGGATWFRVCENLFVEDFRLDGSEIIIAAHSSREQDLWSVYQSDDCGVSWLETVRDVRPTAIGIERTKVGSFWCGALKGNLLLRDPVGAWRTTPWRRVGPEGAAWAAIFATARRGGGRDTLYAYDPRQLGLIASDDGFATWWSENDGLFVGRLVKEGADCCATAGGRSFYASINGQLYVGRLAADPGPQIASAVVAPAVIHPSAPTHLVFSAQVAPSEDGPEAKVAGVQVRRDGFHVDLLDDGAHDDGAAGDGRYGAAVDVGADFLQGSGRWDERWHVPGPVMLEVVAKDAKGRQSTARVPFTILPTQPVQVFWDGDGAHWGSRMANGRRPALPGRFDASAGIIFDIDAEAHGGARCMHLIARHGPWLTGWGKDAEGANLTDTDRLVFWIKATQPTRRDLSVLLSDGPGREADARLSTAVWLIRDGFLAGLTTEYQQVRIPIGRLIGHSAFDLERCAGIAFAGDDPDGHNVFIDDISFERDAP